MVYPVVIIGAGVAGLSAAQEVMKDGHKPVVLEARNRIGGRVQMWQPNKDITICLGASWIHGLDGNPLTEMAKAGKSRSQITTCGGSNSRVVFDVDSKKRINPEKAERIEKALDAALNAYKQRPRPYAETASVADAIDYGVEKLLGGKLDDVDQRLVTLYRQSMCGYMGASGKQAAVEDWDVYEFAGEHSFQETFQPILDQLAAGVDVRLNDPVVEIDTRSSAVAVVRTKAGAEFKCARVIVTLPISTLSPTSEIVFTPELPVWKQKAFTKIGQGLLNKIVLVFDRCFWDADATWIEAASSDESKCIAFFNYQSHFKSPVLMGFGGGPHGDAIEGKSDQHVIGEALKTLASIYGESKVRSARLVSSKVTRWRQEPYSRMSYSYLTAGTRNRYVQQDIARVVDNQIFFAGEATSSYIGTVHGALLSGQRAGQEAVRSLFGVRVGEEASNALELQTDHAEPRQPVSRL